MKFDVVSRATAQYELLGAHSYTHLVSLSDSDRESPPKGCQSIRASNVLCFFFDDISSPHEGYLQASLDDVARICRLAEAFDDESHVLFHCEAGISRSTAAAFISLCVQLGPGKEEQALREVY